MNPDEPTPEEALEWAQDDLNMAFFYALDDPEFAEVKTLIAIHNLNWASWRTR